MQTELPIKTKQPEVTAFEVGLVCRALKNRDWVYARDLRQELPYDDRQLRAIAEHSDGKILSGQKGYRLFDGAACLEDADRSAAWLESQARKMLKRATAIRRRYHRYAQDA